MKQSSNRWLSIIRAPLQKHWHKALDWLCIGLDDTSTFIGGDWREVKTAVGHQGLPGRGGVEEPSVSRHVAARESGGTSDWRPDAATAQAGEVVTSGDEAEWLRDVADQDCPQAT